MEWETKTTIMRMMTIIIKTNVHKRWGTKDGGVVAMVAAQRYFSHFASATRIQPQITHSPKDPSQSEDSTQTHTSRRTDGQTDVPIAQNPLVFCSFNGVYYGGNFGMMMAWQCYKI